MQDDNFENYHSLKLIEALTSLIANQEVDREGVDYLKHTLRYIPWNEMIADSWNELLKLMNGHLRQLETEENYRREMKSYLDKFDNSRQKFEIYEILITYYFQIKQFDNALQEVNNQISLTDSIDDATYICRAQHTKGVIYHVLGQNEKAEEWYKKSYDILREINPDLHYQLFDRTIYSLANLYQHYMGEFGKALEFYLEAYKLAEKLENTERTSFFLDHMAMAEYWLGNYEKAIEYHNSSWQLIEKQERSINVLFHKVQLSMALAKLGKYERVGNELVDVVDLKKNNLDPYSNVLYLIMLSEYWKNSPDNFNELESTFQEELGEIKDHIHLLQQAKSTALQTQHIPSIVAANLYLARNMMEDNPGDAINLLSEAKHIATQNNRLREVREVQKVAELMGLDYETI